MAADPLLGVRDGWLGVLRARGLPALAALPANEQITPPLELVFEAFRYFQPEETQVIIIGQDPFPRAGDATGLAFSSAAQPQALRRVMGCLREHGFVVPEATGALHAWAAQGVLLLNMALTTKVGESKSHMAAWSGFAEAVLDAIPCPAVVMQWGGVAAKVRCPARMHVMQYTHPSPQADNVLAPAFRFAHCPHFTDANAWLQARRRAPVHWGLADPITAFCDGACAGNGKSTAMAGFAAYFRGGPVEELYVHGPVAGQQYGIMDCDTGEVRQDAAAGRMPDAATGRVLVPAPVPDTQVPPTNNRAEWLGFCWACAVLLASEVRAAPIRIVSDSRNTVMTLEQWLPARRAKKTVSDLQNKDLVMIADALLSRLRERCPVALVHVRSHQACPTDPDERFLWSGNAAADAHAGAGAALPHWTIVAPQRPVLGLVRPAAMAAMAAMAAVAAVVAASTTANAMNAAATNAANAVEVKTTKAKTKAKTKVAKEAAASGVQDFLDELFAADTS